MAHGVLRNIAHGVVHGTKLQGALVLGASMVGVTRDATSGIYCPANATEWTTTMAAAGISSGGPSNTWNAQEASGNLSDAIGTATLTAANSPLYQQSVASWTRKAVGWTEATTQKFSGTANLPAMSSTSALVLSYIFSSTAPVATRSVILLGTSVSDGVRILTSGLYQPFSGANVLSGSNVVTSGVRPVVLKHDKTNSVAIYYTDQEKVSPTFAAGGTAGLYFGGQSTAPNGGMVYAALFVGAAAELTDAQIKRLLQTLGWTIPWS